MQLHSRCTSQGLYHRYKNRYRCWWKILIALISVTGFLAVITIWNNAWNKTKQEKPLLYYASTDGIEIADKNHLLYISLAFIDHRFPNVVRAIGLGKISENQFIYCHFHYNKAPFAAVLAQIEPVLIDHEIQYDGFFLDCPLETSMSPGENISLSISDDELKQGHVLFPVSRYSGELKDSGVAACVAPIHGIGKPHHIAAWIEMNRLLGIKHFYFYNYSIPLSLRPLFSYYQQLNIVDVIEWKISGIPINKVGIWPPSNSSLHYFGQFPANNDCLYRAGKNYKFIMFTDLDEIIFPQSIQTIPLLISKFDLPMISEFSFSNSYMRSDFPSIHRQWKSSLLQRTWRENRVLPYGVGSKVIVKFEHALSMGIHSLIETTSLDRPKHEVLSKDAVLLHYRDPPKNLFIPDNGTRIDRLKRLIQRVNDNLKILNFKRVIT